MIWTPNMLRGVMIDYMIKSGATAAEIAKYRAGLVVVLDEDGCRMIVDLIENTPEERVALAKGSHVGKHDHG